jgi:hypothetical protein
MRKSYRYSRETRDRAFRRLVPLIMQASVDALAEFSADASNFLSELADRVEAATKAKRLSRKMRDDLWP